MSDVIQRRTQIAQQIDVWIVARLHMPKVKKIEGDYQRALRIWNKFDADDPDLLPSIVGSIYGIATVLRLGVHLSEVPNLIPYVIQAYIDRTGYQTDPEDPSRQTLAFLISQDK